MSGKSRAGSRVRRFGMGRVADSKIAWLRTLITDQLALIQLDPQEHDEELNIDYMNSEEGPNYILIIPIPGSKRTLNWNFSFMKTDELEATRKFFNHLFDLAEPVVQARDKVADDAQERGDDSYSRVYRAPAQFITRSRQKRQDSKGVLQRSDNPIEGNGSSED